MRAILAIAIIALAVSSVAATLQSDASEPTVNTKYGPIFGFTTEFGTYSFRGVPFAAPPVGKLRFANPVEPEPWTAPRNATDFAPGCYQDCRGSHQLRTLMCTPKLSEDCLYLNVYTPTLNASANLPVIFFIHGGMYEWGSGGIPLYDGSKWAEDQDVIIVTINYRLNIFGALYTGEVTGNFNILDQRMALKWVNENIKNFGGDPTRVTVSGQSAGATSVGIHLVSPGSWPYFQRAAVISNPYGLIPPNKKMASELGTVVLIKLKCPLIGQEQIDCLRNKTTEEIFHAAKTDFIPTPNEVLALFMQWSPFVDGVVIPEQPITAMENQRFHKVPLYIGTVANETIPFIFGVNFAVPEWLMDGALEYVFNTYDAEKIEKLYGRVPAKQESDTRPFFSRIFTDFAFYCPSRYVARQAAKGNGNRVYMYFFDEHPSWALWYTGNNTNAPCYKWICHAFDLPSIFNTYYVLPKTAPHETTGEMKMGKFVQTVWAQFARDGEISPEMGWPKFNNESLTAYNISVPIPTTPLRAYREKFCELFDSIGYNQW